MPVRCAPTPHVCPCTHPYDVCADTGLRRSFPVWEDVIHADERKSSSPQIPCPWRAGDGIVSSSTCPVVGHRGTFGLGRQDCHGSERCSESRLPSPLEFPGTVGELALGRAFPTASGVWLFGGKTLTTLVLFSCHTLLRLFWMRKYHLSEILFFF